MSGSRLSRAQRAAVVFAALLACGLAAYGAAGSYETVSALAEQVGVPLPGLVPLGIDGGLIGVVVLDLVLAWTGSPVGWLRQLARLLTAGTVAANVSAGWPSALSVGLHAAAPLMLLVMLEAARTVLLRRIGIATGLARERIPFGRWVLSPWRTWSLWRRMVLWQIITYQDALATEARLRRARTQLRVHFGRSWKRKAPSDLVWMLGVAPFAGEACEQVHSLTSSTCQAMSTEESPRDPIAVDADRLDEAIRINKRHWAAYARPASSETVRRQLGVGAAEARELTRAVRAMNRAAIDRGPDQDLSSD